MNKISIITGASSGIGFSLAKHLAQKGKQVLAVSRQLAFLQKLQKTYPKNIRILAADLGTPNGREELVRVIPDDTMVEHLVHNAATITPIGPIISCSELAFEKMLAINLVAPLMLTQLLLPKLVHGKVLTISSIGAHEALEGVGPYCVSKAALEMLTQALQLELTKKHVAVTSVIPGDVDTSMQLQLRESSITNLPAVANFQQAAQSGQLIPVDTCAAFLAWLLLDVNPDLYISRQWNIYDDSHHFNWLGNYTFPAIPATYLSLLKK